jgi:hypothetical protein
MNDKEFLTWIYERMKNVHQEDEDVDYMIRFKNIIDSMKTDVHLEHSCVMTQENEEKITKFKDGDVLATDDGNIFVFDGTVEEDKYPFAYCGLTRRRFESYDRRLPFTHNNVHPATKEQRDQLEKAMADAGYTFDFEKKELRKIEQKFAEWGEEDENRFNNLIFLVECSDENEPTKKGFIDFINRLKSTSHQKHWKPNDEQIDVLDEVIRNPYLSTAEYNGLIALREQFKAL